MKVPNVLCIAARGRFHYYPPISCYLHGTWLLVPGSVYPMAPPVPALNRRLEPKTRIRDPGIYRFNFPCEICTKINTVVLRSMHKAKERLGICFGGGSLGLERVPSDLEYTTNSSKRSGCRGNGVVIACMYALLLSVPLFFFPRPFLPLVYRE